MTKALVAMLALLTAGCTTISTTQENPEVKAWRREPNKTDAGDASQHA